MNFCTDCEFNMCEDCYETDCDCNLADHTAAPAQLIKDALAIVSPDRRVELETGDLKAGSYADSASAFTLQVNGRLYRVTVRAMAQGVE